MSNKFIIFAHIPKTAGTSLREAIEKVIPEDEILRDYGKRSETTSSLILDTVYQDAEYELIQYTDARHILFGHFNDSLIRLSGYQKLMPEALLCTFLRDPIKRIVSEYCHFRNNYNYQGSFGTFFRQAPFINRQSRSIDFLPLCVFDFVGLTEYYSLSLEMFTRMSGLKLEENFVNRRAKTKSELSISQAELDEFARLNIDDIAAYNEATYRFLYQSGSWLPMAPKKRFVGCLAPFKGHFISGWAADYSSFRPAEIEILQDEVLIISEDACLFRSDVKQARLHLSGYCGFSIPIEKLPKSVNNTSLVVRIHGGIILGTIYTSSGDSSLKCND